MTDPNSASRHTRHRRVPTARRLIAHLMLAFQYQVEELLAGYEAKGASGARLKKPRR
jgi:hypothetical protein